MFWANVYITTQLIEAEMKQSNGVCHCYLKQWMYHQRYYYINAADKYITHLKKEKYDISFMTPLSEQKNV